MTPVRHQTAAPRSQVKHSTTEPLSSHSLYRDQFCLSKQCWPRSNTTLCIILSESSLLNKSQPGWEHNSSMSEYSEKEKTNESAFCRLLIFLKSSFLKKILSGLPSVSNSLDPDQARHFVGPDLGPNCLQKLSADDTSRHTHYHVGKRNTNGYTRIVSIYFLSPCLQRKKL